MAQEGEMRQVDDNDLCKLMECRKEAGKPGKSKADAVRQAL